jgi:hypothetical protein
MAKTAAATPAISNMPMITPRIFLSTWIEKGKKVKKL